MGAWEVGTPLTGFRITTIDPPSELLESEVKQHGLTEVCHRFLISNDLNQAPFKVLMVSKSCGCIGMKLDDRPLGVDQSFVVESGKDRQISLTIPVPAAGVTDAKNARFRLSRVGGLDVERAIATRVRVIRDFAVNPRRVVLVAGSKGELSQAKVLIDWTHPVGEDSPLPEAVIPKSLEGRVDVTIGQAGSPEMIGALLQTDHLQMLIRARDRSSIEELAEFSDIELKLHDKSMVEHIAVQIADGRSLLTAKEVSFGQVKSGAVSHRAFIVRAADSEPLGRISVAITGEGMVECSTDKDLGGGRLLLTAAFHAMTPGVYQGRVTLSPADGRHKTGTLSYEAKVIP